MLARVNIFNESLWNIGVTIEKKELIQGGFSLTLKK